MIRFSGLSPREDFRLIRPSGSLRSGKSEPTAPNLVVEATRRPWWLVIENKIGEFEQPDQTVRYAEGFCRKGQLGRNVFLIFLTPDERRAESPHFTPMSYHRIAEIRRDLPAEGEAAMLIRHFGRHIRHDLESLTPHFRFDHLLITS